MGKNKILKILLLFAIILFGLGKIYLSRNNSINAKENFSKEFIAQNKKNGKKNAVKQKNIENKNGKRTQNTSNQGNRKYQIDYDHVIGGDENSQGKVTGGHSS